MMTVAPKMWKICDNEWKRSVSYNLIDQDENKTFVIIFDILVLAFGSFIRNMI